KKMPATSGAAGQFHFQIPEAEVRLPAWLVDDPWNHVFVLAMADGYGPAFKAVGPLTLRTPSGAEQENKGREKLAADMTLQLAKDDVPIQGRFIDLQGKPLAGLTVRMRGLYQPKQGDLTAFADALKTRKEGYAAQ